MLHTLCHSILAYFTIFPGMVLFATKKHSLNKYILTLSGALFLNILWFKDVMDLLVILMFILSAPFLYCIEKSLIVRKIRLHINKLQIESIKVVIIVPILEEFLFRKYIYEHVFSSIEGSYLIKILLFIFVSCTGFIVAHIKVLKKKAIYKILLSIICAITYIYTLNIAYCIIIHISFNFLVYVSQIPKMSRRGNFD